MKNTVIIKAMMIIFSINLIHTESDPFSILGIPSLNPSQIFQGDFLNTPKNKQPIPIETFKSNEDLPPFLRNASNLTEKEGLSVLSRYVIVNEPSLKKLGVVFDMSGFDGIMSNESIFPSRTKERLAQRARSAAKIFMKTSFGEDYEAYGAEEYPQLRTDWKMFKVLLMGKKNLGSQVYLRVCIPEDEMMTAIVNALEVDCIDKIKYIEDFRKKSDVYIRRVERAKFFKGNGGKVKAVAENSLTGGNSNTKRFLNNYLNSLNNKSKMNFKKAETFTSPPQNLPLTSPSSLEQKIDGLNSKITNLEQRIEKDEKTISVNSEKIIDLKSSLNQHFRKLDNILDTLANKMK